MLLLPGLLAVVLASAQSGAPGLERAHPRRLLVRLDPDVAQESAAALFPELGLRELWNLPQIGWRAFEVPEGERETTRARLALEPAVREVQRDLRRELALVPNDVLYASQWYLSQIRAPQAWDVETGSPSVVVAVIDTGVDLTHPDLVPNLWTNAGEIPGNGLDDDGNGYSDDVRGYDFAHLDSDPSDDNGHGTACAGIVAAAQANGIGISGVAPGCRIAVVKAAPASGHFYASATVPALVYCADMGFEVLSMSFFSDEVVPAERDALAYCAKLGVLPVVAAGNQNSVHPTYPAAYASTLAVGATFDAGDGRAFFSNWGTWVDVAAPGWMLATTSPFGGYDSGFAGTSGAAPQVAGIAALLFSAAPLSTADAVRAAIEDTCLPLDQAPYGRWTSYGRVVAEAALERVRGLSAGSVPPRVTFAAPCGGKGLMLSGGFFGQTPPREELALEVHGVGLEPPATALVRSGTRTLTLLSQQRHLLRARGPFSGGATLEVQSSGALIESWPWDSGPGLVYAASDAGTEDTLGSSASGGWRELVATDGRLFTCSADALAEITCEFTVRAVRVPDLGRLTLEIRRDYDGMLPGAEETIELYDWSSASYPYGSWVTLANGPAHANWRTLMFDVPGDPNRYRDLEGTFYLRLRTTGAGPSGLLEAEFLRLRAR